ncbi:MAG: hypothetical protein R3E97_20205 [Candidatus Eisenbacteria bacterium]
MLLRDAFTVPASPKLALRLTLAVVGFLASGVSPAGAHVAFFNESLTGAEVVPPTATAGVGSLYGEFSLREPPLCSTEAPFVFGISTDHLEGTITGLVIRLGGPEGEELARLEPGARSFHVGEAVCEVLESERDLLEDGADWPAFRTSIHVSIETDAHPTGEIGGNLYVGFHAPTLTRSWGEVKGIYH